MASKHKGRQGSSWTLLAAEEEGEEEEGLLNNSSYEALHYAVPFIHSSLPKSYAQICCSGLNRLYSLGFMTM
jgi:hypothetical protein